MKKSILLMALLLSSAMYQAANAQVSVNINIGQQPVWGPVGYDYVDYYYFPDADVYYNVPNRQYVYFDGRSWAFSVSLPARYRSFDVYNSYKVVINEPNPFYRNNYWRSRYASYRGRRQDIIYNSREPKYYVIENHPEHGRWMESGRQGSYANNNRGYNSPQRNDNRYDNNRYDNNRNTESNRNNNRVMEQRHDMEDHRVAEQTRGNQPDRSNNRTPDRRNDGDRNNNSRRF